MLSCTYDECERQFRDKFQTKLEHHIKCHVNGTVRKAKNPNWTKETAASVVEEIIHKYQCIPPTDFLVEGGGGGRGGWVSEGGDLLI